MMKWMLPAGLGVLATFAHAPIDLTFLGPLSLAAMMLLLRQATARQAGLAMWLFGIAHFSSGLYWIWISTHVHGGAPAWLSVLLIAGLSAYLSLYAAFAVFLAQRIANFTLRSLIAWPGLILAGELLRGWVFTGFPWLSWGYPLLDTPWDNLAALGGVHMLSFMVVLAAGLLALMVDSLVRKKFSPVLLLPAVFIGITAFAPTPASWTTVTGEIDAALVQGNISQDRKWRLDERLPTLELYRDLSYPVLDQRLIIWPEVAATVPLEQLKPSYLAGLDQLAKSSDTSMLIGLLDRKSEGVYNAVSMIGQDSGLYYKQHLVPFGEYFPIPDFLRPMMDVLGLPYSDLRAGDDNQALLSVDGHRIGLSICFEDVFGNEFRQRFGRAPLLVNLTNDAWFNDSSAPHQHLAIARMRAMENGKELLRVANTGISGRISADGELLESLSQFSRGVLVVKGQWRDGQTPYAQLGDWPVRLLAVFAIVGLLIYSRRNVPA